VACCLAVALVIAVLRAGWYRLAPGRRPVRAGFAPPARRPAPGVASLAAVGTAGSAGSTGPSVEFSAGSVRSLIGSVDRLAPAGELVPTPSVPARGRVGFVLVVVGAGWTVASGIAMHLPSGPTQHHGMAGLDHAAVPGFGATGSMTHGSGLTGLLMHGPGLVAIALGVLLVLSASARGAASRGAAVRGAASRRPSHRPLSPRPRRAT